MKNKYYTPEITEFHVGFEYERWYKVSEFSEGQSGWISCTFPNDPIYGGMLLPHRFKVDNTRVKYLDQEDIESLGFVSILPEWSNPAKFTFYKSSELEKFQNLKECTIKIIFISGSFEEDYLSIYLNNKCIFSGFLKNKSELKKLLKQLNIM